MRSFGKILAALCTASVSAACALGALISYRVSPDYPRNDSESIVFAAVENPVRVYFDPQGVAHIDAGSERDLLAAVGFVHGRCRFFQMDMLRRIARGRVSELVGDRPLLGSTTVGFDNAMRGWGLGETADADPDRLPPEMRGLLEAYARGVNEALAPYRPVEYRLLGAAPEPWTVADSFAVGRLSSWSITHNWNQETARLLLALYVGWERADEIYPSDPWNGAVTIPLDGEPRPLPPAVVEEVKEMFPPRGVAGVPEGQTALGPAAFALDAAGASNAWVVGGNRSASGKPLLASDPHLSHFLPSIVIQQHLRSPGFETIGATTPGVPYTLFGHNGRVAWGITSAVADTIDLFVEKPNPNDPRQVLTPDGYKDLAEEEVKIRIRDGGDFFEKRFIHRHSRNGVLLNDMYPEIFPPWAPPVALHWDTAGAGSGIEAVRNEGFAKNVAELRKVLSGMVLPVNVYTAADADGTIATFSTGSIPLRPNHRGTFPVPGWLDKYRWTGYAPADRMPFASASGDAFFVHANNLIWDPGKAPFVFHVDSAPSYRRDRIVEMIQARPVHDVECFASMQRDVKLLRAARLAPIMTAAIEGESGLNEREKKALDLLENWDFIASADAAAPSIFFMTYLKAALTALEDEIAPAGRSFALSQRYSTAMVDLWYDSPETPAWDDRRTPERETMREALPIAFKAAVAELDEDLGGEPETWAWGHLHSLHFKHFMGSHPMLASLMNIEERGIGGGMDSVWKTHFDLGDRDHPFKTVAGPVYRMVVDMGDLPHAWWIIDTGASGWPGDPHYADQNPLWLEGRLVPMISDWDAIKAGAEAVVELEPEK